MLKVIFIIFILSTSANAGQSSNKTKVDQMVVKISKSFPEVKHISVAEYLKISQGKRKTILVDVREKRELRVSMIPGAIVQEQFEKDLSKYKDYNVVVYCTIGQRSSEYARKLEKKGFAHSFNLKGGVLSWAHQGKKFLKAKEETKEVHVYGSSWNLLPSSYTGVED